MLISAPLARASSPIAEKTLVGTDSGPIWTTSSKAPLEVASRWVGTAIEATTVTRR